MKASLSVEALESRTSAAASPRGCPRLVQRAEWYLATGGGSSEGTHRALSLCGSTEMTVPVTFEYSPPIAGQVVYDSDEYSLRFTPDSPIQVARRSGTAGVTSLAIGTLQVEVACETRVLLYVWGLHPRGLWQDEALVIPKMRSGTIRISEPVDLVAAVSLRMPGSEDWRSSYDLSSGWLRIGRCCRECEDHCIMVATDTAFGISSGELMSIWLRPVMR